MLNNVSFTLNPSSRIGLIGPNGAGKSTLIKTIVGELETLGGKSYFGNHLQIGYFNQQQLTSLDLKKSATEQMMEKFSVKEQNVRDFLGSFGFSKNLALTPIEHFSGGEKSRFALAMIAWQKPNLLVLDEPTNHLDIQMRQALALAIDSFDGAMVLVSHDRHLLRSSVDEFWLVADGLVSKFQGDIDDYQLWLDNHKNRKSQSLTISQRKQQRQQQAQKRHQSQTLKKTINALEIKMENLQTQLKQQHKLFSDKDLYHSQNKSKLKEAITNQKTLESQFEYIQNQWLEKSQQLDEID